ncbi:unnamed protein product [Parnassius apollo]|uniref:(apollo) hypothetical protein n=1 Tax=Parnassius apollo TaxID=110799 RepID=A0A8S3X142_PARAO|nr:unnamed protein product [Parnassius apollo]
MLVLSLFSVYIITGALGQTPEFPSITIGQGTIIGSISSVGDYFEFYGIPYADSVSGSNRFKAPSPPPASESTFIANRKDIRCVRPLGVGYEGIEDCLVANVFTPSINDTSLLPVMVWIKGKEFDNVNEHKFSFRNFMNSNVVIVSLNYRESILGFLCLGTEEAPGNAGLKDIIAGLNWVKHNIVQFGGDPDNISLFGHGSGAAAVDLVSLSPMAKGLVHKVIAQSGTALAPWAITRDNLKYAVEVAEGLGHSVNSIQNLIDAFKRTSVAALMAVINELDLTDNSLAFAPCIEKDNLENVEPFLIKSPYQILIEGDYENMPFMTGFVDNEGTIRADEAIESKWLEKMEESFINFIQPDLDLGKDEQDIDVVETIKSFYFGTEPINMSQIDNFFSYHGDTMVLVSAIREARLRANTSSSPIYLYQFSYKGTLETPFIGSAVVNGTAHSEELAYLFYDDSDVTSTEMDLTVSEILVERWTNFAKTGTPGTEVSQIEWKPFSTESNNYLRILDDEEMNVDQGGSVEVDLINPHPEKIIFWDQLYSEYFVDAKGRWVLEERVEEGDEEVAVEEGTGEEQGSEDADTEGDNENDEDNESNDNNSATTLFGYTFLMVSFYAFLDKFHMWQLMS